MEKKDYKEKQTKETKALKSCKQSKLTKDYRSRKKTNTSALALKVGNKRSDNSC
jgi:hypothetical protein